jgi:hypothetical protein
MLYDILAVHCTLLIILAFVTKTCHVCLLYVIEHFNFHTAKILFCYTVYFKTEEFTCIPQITLWAKPDDAGLFIKQVWSLFYKLTEVITEHQHIAMVCSPQFVVILYNRRFLCAEFQDAKCRWFCVEVFLWVRSVSKVLRLIKCSMLHTDTFY